MYIYVTLLDLHWHGEAKYRRRASLPHRYRPGIEQGFSVKSRNIFFIYCVVVLKNSIL